MLKSLTGWIITNCGKLLKRWEYKTILSVSWETCMWVKMQQLELCMEQLTGSGLRKEYNKAVVYCHPVYLTYTQSTSWEMPGWVSYKLESRLPGEISTTSNMYMNHPKGRKRRETKEPLDKGEGGEWKSQLKTQYWKTKIMTPLPITSQQIEGENMEAVTDFPSQALTSLWMGTSAMTLENDCFLAGNLWLT